MNKLVCLLATAALVSADSFSSYQAPGSRGSSGGLGSLSGATVIGTSQPTFVGTSGPRLVGGGSSFGSVGSSNFGSSSSSSFSSAGSSNFGAVGSSSFGSVRSSSFGNSGSNGGSVRGSGAGRPQITRNIYLYEAPAQTAAPAGPPPKLPARKVHYNFVFVRTSNLASSVKPIVAPAPQQKTLVYVLSKRPAAGQQEVIEVPHTPTQPEVFFVNYNDGDNTNLPGGVSLQQALSQSVQQGQVIQGGAGTGGSVGGAGGHGNIGFGSGHGQGSGQGSVGGRYA